MTTTAILCIGRNEAPFAEEWAHYHFHLGFDRLYYVSTDDDPAAALRFVDGSRFRSRMVLHHFSDFRHGWQIRCYNEHRPLIEEDWVLVIDLDEFLSLHPFSSIQEYLRTVPEDVGQVQFPWLLMMPSAYSCERVLGIFDGSVGHASDHVKSMIRLDARSSLGVHSHRVDPLKTRLSSGTEVEPSPVHRSVLSETAYFDRHPCVLHFASRGHLDVMNRIVDHKFFNSKSGDAERERLASFLRGPADWSSIPTRCLLTKFYTALPPVRPRIAIPRLDERTDVDDLRRLFRKHVRTVVDFEDGDLDGMEERFEQSYGFAEKLESLDPGGAIRLDEYLECRTQEEYVQRLRRALEDDSRQRPRASRSARRENSRARRVAVLVLACASPPYDRLVETIRRTWGRRHVPDMDVYYVYGNPEAGGPSDQLARFVGGELPPVEADGIRQIGDVLIAGCADSIGEQEDCLLRKRLLAFAHLCGTGGYDLVYTVCAASYVDFDELRVFVSSMPGRLAVVGSVSIDPTATAPFVSGASMLLTADVAQRLAGDREDIIERNRFCFRDDVTIGHWIADHLSEVPTARIVEDIDQGRPLTREHVLLSASGTTVDFVLARAEDQRPSADAYHYHFHSRRPGDMESFHARFFADRVGRTGERPGGIRYVQIFGERCSGTVYLTRLVEKNFGRVELTSSFGFKHWFIRDHGPRGRGNRSTDFQCVRRLDDSDDTLFIVIHRNPLDWLRSLQTKPYHAPGHWNLPLSTFLRKPWLCTEQTRANLLWPRDEESRYFIEEAENVLRLRSEKARHFLNLEGIVPNIVFVRYEDLLDDLGVLERVAGEFGIPLRHRRLENETSYFGGSEGETFRDRKPYPPISPEDVGFIRRNLDWEVESTLGYEWDDLRRQIDDEWSSIGTGTLPGQGRR